MSDLGRGRARLGMAGLRDWNAPLRYPLTR
jgi:hypothetical protein